jgi:hypothetical protein
MTPSIAERCGWAERRSQEGEPAPSHTDVRSARPRSVRETQDQRHLGAHFLWFVSLLRNKEMNPACCAAADGKKFLSKNVKPYQRM